ncbi:DNA cytosine methyltransferase [uncultured Paracoccus sp.]|uniref:DNA cytosine methyltransferase n=1 Tax=uncultured Paracoccus sp. TaxID=189685 RepID=UPI0025D06ACA|nr:DNA cytosine methyltransferase [uncultured Paracoccus sp.]
MVGGYLPGLAEHGPGSAGHADTATAERRARPFRAAPVWGDLRTFVGHGWRGHIDTILAGYPCQPFSAAGQRRGADDERHLWPDVARIAREVAPEWLFLENVAGHVSLGLETVLRDIWHMGFTPAAGLFSAGETGAPHERLRVFIVAHRKGGDRRGEQSTGSTGRGWPRLAGSGAELADADGGHASAERQQRGGEFGFQPEGRGTGAGAVGDAEGIGRRQGRPQPEIRRGRDTSASAGSAMADASCRRSDGQGSGQVQQPWRTEAIGSGTTMADARQPGPQGREQRGPSDERHGPQAHGSAAQRGRPCLHPPGPAEADRWAVILGAAPYLAPAASLRDCLAWAGDLAAALEGPGGAQTKSRLCRMADGLAARSRALRGLGNGVHPLAAGYAWRALAAAHGLGPVDLDAEGRGDPSTNQTTQPFLMEASA